MTQIKKLSLTRFQSEGKLSVRAYNTCASLGVRSLTDLAHFIEEKKDFLKARNCGVKTRDEINYFFESHKYLLAPTPRKNNNIKQHSETVLSSFNNRRFENYLKSEFLLLSVRARNGFLDIFKEKMPTYQEFRQTFIEHSYDLREQRNIGRKSGDELDTFVIKVKNFLNFTLTQPLTNEEELTVKLSILTGINNISLETLQAALVKRLDILNFIDENLKDFLGLKSIEEYILRRKFETSIGYSLKISITKERIRQIEKQLFQEIPQLVHTKTQALLEYCSLSDFVLPALYIDISTFNWKDSGIESMVKNYPLFSTFILSNIFKEKFFCITKLDKFTRPETIHDYDIYNYSKRIKGAYLIRHSIITKSNFIELYSNILEEISKRQEGDKIISLESYFSKSSDVASELFVDIISNILNAETKGILIESNQIIIKRNTPRLIHEYAIEALTHLRRPSHISDIYSQILKYHPDFDSSEDSVKSTITRTKNVFIYFGRSSTYGLKIWERQHENIKGGTIRAIVEEFLSGFDHPCHISAIGEFVNRYRKTNDYSIITNLKIAGDKRFRFFKNGYVGLSGKNYTSNSNHNRKLEEVSLDELLNTIFLK